MRQEKKTKDRPAIALVLFFCLAALVAVFAVTSTVSKVRDNLQVDKAAEVVKKKAVNKTQEKATTKVVDSQDGKSSGSSSSSGFTKPLSGEVIQKYSMDMPIYWETGSVHDSRRRRSGCAACGNQRQDMRQRYRHRIEQDDRYGMIVESATATIYYPSTAIWRKDGLVELGEVVSCGDLSSSAKSARHPHSKPAARSICIFR